VPEQILTKYILGCRTLRSLKPKKELFMATSLGFDPNRSDTVTGVGQGNEYRESDSSSSKFKNASSDALQKQGNQAKSSSQTKDVKDFNPIDEDSESCCQKVGDYFREPFPLSREWDQEKNVSYRRSGCSAIAAPPHAQRPDRDCAEQSFAPIACSPLGIHSYSPSRLRCDSALSLRAMAASPYSLRSQ
jgi:hypothetical protein